MKTATIPFAIGILLALLSAGSAEAVTRRAVEFAKGAENLDARTIEPFAIWSADAAQAFVATVAPGISGLLLVHAKSTTLSVAYIGLMVIGFLVFCRVLFQRPDRYSSWRKLNLTVVAWVSIALNLALGIAVELL